MPKTTVKFLLNHAVPRVERSDPLSALRLFHAAAERVPAYKDFLKKHRINHVQVKKVADFEKVPPVTKSEYLRAYPLEALVWDGKLKKHAVFTATSGSTGTPFYFPRDERVDQRAAAVHAMFLDLAPRARTTPTLVIVGFGMGVWIGGLITYKAFEIIARKGRASISIITPGINKAEILNSLRYIAPKYERVILAGYPPFIKDVLDEAESSRIDLHTLNLRLLFAAEPFTEKFRDYVSAKARIEEPLRDTMNIYGTADLGPMAWETPLAIALRRLALHDEGLREELFRGAVKTPTLAQFVPDWVHFDALEDELLVTGDSAIPLLRYAIGDHGGVLRFEDAISLSKGRGVDLLAELREAGISGMRRLPFVYVYERKDFSTTLYGLQVYPEPVREAFLAGTGSRMLTGKFTMQTKFNKRQDQYLEIHVELKRGKHPKAEEKARIRTELVGKLSEKNSEFRELLRHLGSRAWPKIVFWPAEHSKYFKPGIKQQWITKHP